MPNVFSFISRYGLIIRNCRLLGGQSKRDRFIIRAFGSFMDEFVVKVYFGVI
jgi:hypothetical protein